MDVVDAIKALLGCELVDGATQAHAILEEKDPEAKLKKVTLSELKKGMLLLKVDEGRKGKYKNKKVPDCMSPLFRIDGTYDHNRACDAVLLRSVTPNEVVVYYIDLKSDKPAGYQGQFKSTRCFIYYVQKLLAELLNVNMQIRSERFIILHTDSNNATQSVRKRPTKPTPAAANSADVPDKRIVRNNCTIACTEIFR